ncbi:MAG: tRNA pseudouridine(38-40) synthase TruA [Alphaproteobacteria bacterium]|jgi:tRNA pseudouridine38-40 synthase|nr:tRNA pseudouridine(38-40) synthase TruA [Alphaproteobacteria bacterium]
MPRFALLVEYDGGAFHGWQRQPGMISVQEALETAAARLNDGAVPTAIAAGRTDAGVHAIGQVAELRIAREITPDRLRLALNYHLQPARCVVRAAAMAPEGWWARFSAIRRAYRYRILNRPSRPALLAGQAWHIPHALDVAAMHEAAQALLGRHDFSAFRAASCQAKSALRTLERLDVSRHGEELLIDVEARSFLHHQVRNLVGTLAPVGLGRRPPDWPRAVLDSRDRRLAGETAPADGLCFMRVDYPPDAGLLWV